MNASKPYKEQDEQEQNEMAEREAHEDGLCMGIPLCGYCLDDWEEQLEEWDRLAYYNSRGNLEK
ncbi:MAG: hypothetical protein V4563_14670 [Pseudomonadota bacterium]